MSSELLVLSSLTAYVRKAESQPGMILAYSCLLENVDAWFRRLVSFCRNVSGQKSQPLKMFTIFSVIRQSKVDIFAYEFP